MAKKSIFSSVSREKKDNSKTALIALSSVVALLLIFILYCAVFFSGDGTYGNAVHDISEMKIQLEEKDSQVNTLKEQINTLEEQKRKLEDELSAIKATPAPQDDDDTQ